MILFSLPSSPSYFIRIDLFADGNDFSWETVERGRNTYYQKQLAIQITSQITQINSLIISALNIYLNIGQNLTMNTSSVFMSLETTSISSLPNKLIQQVGNAQIRMPSHFTLSTNNSSSSISVRVRLLQMCLFFNSLFSLCLV
jgi:hypothetical protein